LLAKAGCEPAYRYFGGFRRPEEPPSLKPSNPERFKRGYVQLIDEECMGAQPIGFA